MGYEKQRTNIGLHDEYSHRVVLSHATYLFLEGK